MSKPRFYKGDIVRYIGFNEDFRINYRILEDVYPGEESASCEWLQAFNEFHLGYYGRISPEALVLVSRGKEWNPIHNKIKELEQRHSEYLLMKKVA